jgi:hypothetical protein
MVKKIIISLFIIILLLIFWPKAYDTSGGFEWKEYSNDKKCLGFQYDNDSHKCDDCIVFRYCAGLIISK